MNMKTILIILVIISVINWMARNHIMNNQSLERLLQPVHADEIIFVITRIIQVILGVIAIIKLIILVF